MNAISKTTMEGELLSPRDMVRAVGKTHPLNGGRIDCLVRAGSSITEILIEALAARPDLTLRRDFIGPQRVAGLQFSHLRPDGTAAWALRLMGTDLVVECNRYTRWERVWEATRKYLQAGFEAVPDRKIIAIGCMVLDAFPTNREDYDLETLFRPGPMLAGRIFKSGPTWHNHLGWFDGRPSFAPSCHWLNQLNIDAVRLAGSDLRVQIMHNQELRFDPDATEIPAASDLDVWFSELHLNNKRILIELLEQSVSRQIGLDLK